MRYLLKDMPLSTSLLVLVTLFRAGRQRASCGVHLQHA
jgi:hypothetical protein